MTPGWNLRFRKTRAKPTRVAHYAEVRTIASRDDLPSELGYDIFLIERGGRPLWVVMSCPCRCGDRIDVNLMRSKRPYWRLRKYKGTVSLYPSLWVSSEKCGSHFFLVRNTVRWVRSWPGYQRSAP